MKNSFSKADILLILAALILAAGYYGSVATADRTRDRWYGEKLEAARLMQAAMTAVREEKVQRGIPVDKTVDINNTGLIGEEWGGITTTLGSLEAKRTTANPDFAAVVVDMLKEAGLKEGELVAVNFSGSFPAMNLAVLSALEALKLEASIISSTGASTWGANDPYFTYPDMEQALYDKGIIRYRSKAVSLGGADDMGGDMEEEARKSLLGRFQEQGRRVILQPDFGLNLRQRLEIYRESGKPVQCFVNVGGNLISSGGSEDFTRLKTGLLKNSKYTSDSKVKGLIQYFLDSGIPVINLINIKGLALQYGIPVDPYPLPAVGEGEIYYENSYPYAAVVISLILSFLLLLIYIRSVRR